MLSVRSCRARALRYSRTQNSRTSVNTQEFSIALRRLNASGFESLLQMLCCNTAVVEEEGGLRCEFDDVIRSVTL